ncbi:DnaJ-domain-containing protein, partial [Obba rivulosa]
MVAHIRHASTSANSFPFPTHPHPTPHQIFHLSPSASQQEIKARYYDLVRLHHPDSPMCQHISPSERHTRFQRISAAYAALRSPDSRGLYESSVDPFREELARRRRAQMRREAEMARHPRSAGMAGAGGEEWAAGGDDRWKDRVMIMIGLVSLVVGLYPALIWQNMGAVDGRHRAAAKNLAQARRDAREHGQEQRLQIRKRVEENRRLAREAKERETELSEPGVGTQ